MSSQAISCPYCLNGYNDEHTGAIIKLGMDEKDRHCCDECVGDAIQPLLDYQVDFDVSYVGNEHKVKSNKQKDEK